MPEDWEHGGFGLYLHWPFCQSKCPYCDFNSHVSASIDQGQWKSAYLAEIDRAGRETDGRILNTVFFGGGTPSLMDPEMVAALLQRIRQTWRTSNSLEVTLEANPTSVEAGRFAGYRDAGVNRVSMGIQSLEDKHLRALGRLHTAREAMDAFEIARHVFDRVSFDLIYARQDQTLAGWRDELSRALALAVDHLSLYQLTIEQGTTFGDRYAAGKLRGLPDDDSAADMYELTQELCDAAGMPAYEVSNHAKPGQESRHNQIYWRYGDYLGIGPGAHGRITTAGIRTATEAIRAPAAWLAAVEGRRSGELERDSLSAQDELTEFLLMGLRLVEGVSVDRLAALGGSVLAHNINRLAQDDLMETLGDRLAVTHSGRPILNEVLRQLLAD